MDYYISIFNLGKKNNFGKMLDQYVITSLPLANLRKWYIGIQRRRFASEIFTILRLRLQSKFYTWLIILGPRQTLLKSIKRYENPCFYQFFL